MKIMIPSHLSDAELAAELTRRTRREREAISHFIAGIAEFDLRRLYLPAGFPSMFAYCTEALFLSEDAAYNRIEVARTARAFPLILDMLEDGRLSLATVRALASKLTPENHVELLAAASRKSRRQVEELVAQRFPRPHVRPLIRKLPAPAVLTGFWRRGLTGSGGRRSHMGAGSTARFQATTGRAAPGSRPLSGPLHRERRDARQAEGGPGPLAARGAERRRGGDRRPGADRAPERAQAEEVRDHGAASPE
jgi:hypothetical protein